ncbi:MAG: phosphohydrolase [Lachnospiraceae bacterium]|nr:phosphohydrolase [Lachnospiraceae bacterium]
MSYITTTTGKHFDPAEPEEALLDLYDIAHSLAFVCRANGHMRIFYSVAQHSIACAREAIERGHGREIVLACLLHDASEAYLSDVIRPVKKDLPYYLEVEARLQDMIWRHFIGRLPSSEEEAEVFAIDDQMLSMEFRQLMPEELGEDYRKLKREFQCEYRDPAEVVREFLALAKEHGVC